MKRPRWLVPFVILNILVSTGVAFAVISVVGLPQQTSSVIPVTVPVLVTATRDPDRESTLIAQAVAGTVTVEVEDFLATNAPNSVDLPDDILDELGTPRAVATLDPDLLAANPELQSTASALPDGCELYTLEDGDNPSLVAEDFGVSLNSILTVNNLTEDDAVFLQIGDPLIIPLEGCPIEDFIVANAESADAADADEEDADADATDDPDAEDGTDEADEGDDDTEVAAAEAVDDEDAEEDGTPTETPTVTATPSPTPSDTPTVTLTPTLTLAATAVNAQVEIIAVRNVGDITAEGIEIRNNGNTVDLNGWTITDAQDNVYTFGDQRLFPNGLITVFTRDDVDTPISKFWGLSEPVWADEGETATLRNAAGAVQSSFRVGTAGN